MTLRRLQIKIQKPGPIAQLVIGAEASVQSSPESKLQQDLSQYNNGRWRWRGHLSTHNWHEGPQKVLFDFQVVERHCILLFTHDHTSCGL